MGTETRVLILEDVPDNAKLAQREFPVIILAGSISEEAAVERTLGRIESAGGTGATDDGWRIAYQRPSKTVPYSSLDPNTQAVIQAKLLQRLGA